MSKIIDDIVRRRLNAQAKVDRRRIGVKSMLSVVALAFILWAAAELSSSRMTYAFRLTVQVEAGGKLREGSGVIRVRHKGPPRWLFASSRTNVEGEAIAIDLESRGIVFTALLDDSIGMLVPRVFGTRPFPVDEKDAAAHPLPPLGAKAEVTGRGIQAFVTFGDRNDPRSARVVPVGELGKVFGDDVRFGGARIEMTNASVTRGIERLLPWLKAAPNYLSGGVGCGLGDPHCLQSVNFKRD